MALFAILPAVPLVKAAFIGLGGAVVTVGGWLGLSKAKPGEAPIQPQQASKPAQAKFEPKAPPKPAARRVSLFERLKQVVLAAWEIIKKMALNVARFAWFWVKRAAVAAVEFCSRLLKRLRDPEGEKRLERALCLHSKVQNLEVAGVLQSFTKSPPRNKNAIPEALAG
jgi:hypothetical protein